MPIMNCYQCQELGLNSAARCAICHIKDKMDVRPVQLEDAISDTKALALSKRLFIVPDCVSAYGYEIICNGKKIYAGNFAACREFILKFAD